MSRLVRGFHLLMSSYIYLPETFINFTTWHNSQMDLFK